MKVIMSYAKMNRGHSGKEFTGGCGRTFFENPKKENTHPIFLG
jgi:hypothetical protein